MPQFDVDGARKAGYSDAEILSHLTATRKFDVAGARKSGYNDGEIIDYLSKQKAPSGKPSSVFSSILERSTRNRDADAQVATLEESKRRPNAATLAESESKLTGLPVTVANAPDDTLVGGLKQQFVDPLYRPMQTAKLALEGVSDRTLGAVATAAAAGLTAGVLEYAKSTPLGEGLSVGLRRTLNLTSDVALDPINLLPVGALLSKARPALRIGADLLFAGIQEVGAIQALRKGDYADAGVQQAFALIGAAGAGHGFNELSEGRKKLIFEEARTRENARTDAQIKTDIGFYRKLAEQTKTKATDEVAQFNRLKEKAEASPVEQQTADAGATEAQPVETSTAPVEQTPAVSGEPAPTQKPESTTASLYADLGKIREHPAKGNAEPTQEQAIEYIHQIRQAAEAHLPEALDSVHAAEQAIQNGDMPGFVKAAEEARGKLRASYGERLAADEAARQGIELPAKQAPVDPEKLLDESVRSELHAWASNNKRRVLSLVEWIKEQGGMKDEGGDLRAREYHKTNMRADNLKGSILNNKSGISADDMRHAAFEAGYLDSDRGTIGEFFDVIDRELGANGSKIYPKGSEPGEFDAIFDDLGYSRKQIAAALNNEKGTIYEKARARMQEAIQERENGQIAEFNRLREKAEGAAPADEEGDLSGPTPDNPDLSFDFGDSMLESFDNMERQARERLAARGDKGRMGSEKGASPILDDINDLITIGVAKIGKGTIRFARWSAEMISEFGDRVRPHLQEIYSKSLERARELKNFDADEYFNFKRVKLSDAEKQRLIDRVTEETLATGRVPKEKITFEEVKADAKAMAGEDILKYVDNAQKGATEYRAARLAMRQRINTLSGEVVELRQKVADIGTADPAGAMALERELLVKESDLSALLDSHMRIRSEEGRNLAINRMESDSTWDLSYWMNRARQAEGLPPNVPPSESVARKIQEVHAEGVAAQAELDAAEKVVTTWGTQPDLPTATPATTGPFPGPIPSPPVPSAPVQTTWGIQGALPGAPTPPPIPTGGTLGPPPPAVRARVVRARRAVQVARQNMAATVTKLQKSGWLDTTSSLRKAGLFGVFTRARNIGANAAFQVAEEVSRIPAVLVDMAVSLGGGDRQVQGISPRAIAKSAYYAATQGLRDAGDAIRYGVTTNELGKVEIQKPLNSGVRWLDQFANFQFREMSAEDRIFKSYAFRRSLEEQLWLESRRTGTPMPSEAQIQSSIQAAKMRGQGSGVPAPLTPNEQMIANAITYAEYATFNNRNMLASALRSGQSTLKGKGPAGQAAAFAVDMIVPFANTPANVIARQFDYTALGAVPRMITAAVRGLGGPERRTFELALGRGLTGSALIYAGWKLSEKGLATGTWEEEAGQRNVSEAAGRTPGAVRIGNRWIGTGQLAPAGSLLMIGAALQREATQPIKNEMSRFGKIAGIGTKAAMEQPFLAGMSNLVEAMQNPGNRGERFVSSAVGSFVPTYLSEISAGFDPYLRDPRPEGTAETLYKGAQARTPARFEMPTRLDVLGRPRGNFTVGSQALELSDSIRNELQANSVSVGFPQRKPDETATTYRLRSQFVGRLIDQHVGQVLNRPGYPTASSDKRREWIDKAVGDAREQASQTLDRKFKTEDAHEKFLLDQIDRVESRLKNRKEIPMIPPAPTTTARRKVAVQ